MHGPRVIIVCLQISQLGSFGECLNKLCLPPGLFDDGFSNRDVGGGIAGGGSASTASVEDLDAPSLTPSVNVSGHTGSSSNEGFPDAVRSGRDHQWTMVFHLTLHPFSLFLILDKRTHLGSTRMCVHSPRTSVPKRGRLVNIPTF